MALSLDEHGDVITTIDLQDETDARRWATESASNKPWRPEFRAAFVDVLREMVPAPERILELGSGPGLLAKRVLEDLTLAEYVLFDFSVPMMAMAREALGERENVTYHLGDFRDATWPAKLSPPLDAIISMQAVHEIRHKRHVPGLYARAARLLRPGGLLLICDAEPTADRPPLIHELASTRREQELALLWAGLENFRCHKFAHQYYLLSATKPA